MYKKTKLDNGLRVATCVIPAMQSVALGIWIKVGGRYESSDLKGIAHYLEHLVFKGTKNYSCRKLKESIEGVGGALNGFTSEELTCYLAKLPARHLDTALDILSDMAVNPLLQECDIEKERTVILEEIKMYKDLPQSYVYDLLDNLLWPKQPLGLSVIGTAESVTKINSQDLASFKEFYYTPSNIVISAAGLLDHDKLIDKIGKKFDSREAKHTNNFAKAQEEQDKPQLNVLLKETEQTHMALGFHSFKRDDPLRHAISLLHIILGANMSSRLFNEVREKRGLAYEIGTLVKRFQDTGAFIVHAGMDNRKVTDAVKLILEELEKIKYTLVSPGEFQRAKEFYLGQIMLALEDTLDHMLWIGESQATIDKIYLLKDIIKEVNQLKRQDIRETAQRVFKKENLNLALIGPLKEAEGSIYKELILN